MLPVTLRMTPCVTLRVTARRSQPLHIDGCASTVATPIVGEGDMLGLRVVNWCAEPQYVRLLVVEEAPGLSVAPLACMHALDEVEPAHKLCGLAADVAPTHALASALPVIPWGLMAVAPASKALLRMTASDVRAACCRRACERSGDAALLSMPGCRHFASASSCSCRPRRWTHWRMRGSAARWMRRRAKVTAVASYRRCASPPSPRHRQLCVCACVVQSPLLPPFTPARVAWSRLDPLPLRRRRPCTRSFSTSTFVRRDQCSVH
jgi:hypothetical protein